MRSRATVLVVLGLLAAGGCGDDGASSTGSGASSSTGNAGTGGGGGADATGGGGAGGEDRAPRADPTAFRATASLAVGRGHHTATLLEDGRVLVVGGENASATPLDGVEVFDPGTETWTTLAPLPAPRSNHAALRLADGRVLVTGGGLTNQNGSPSGEGVVATALIFDPATGSFSPTGDMLEPREGHLMTLLPDGRVLVLGGATDEVGSQCTGVPDCTYGKALDTAEVWLPDSGEFTALPGMTDPRILFFATPLADGRVLVAGGADDVSSLDSTDVFDPAASSFEPAASLGDARFRLAGALLGSGNVVVTGGKLANIGPIATSELFDAASQTWRPVGDIARPMTGHVVIPLESGRALSVGGFDQEDGATLDQASIFDEGTESWSPIGGLTVPRTNHTATRLADGRVLIAGGISPSATCMIGE